MRPEVHLHPDRLRSHAAVAGATSHALRAALVAPDPPAMGDPSFAAEMERLETAARRAVRELAELSVALATAASAAESADDEAAATLRAAVDPR